MLFKLLKSLGQATVALFAVVLFALAVVAFGVALPVWLASLLVGAGMSPGVVFLGVVLYYIVIAAVVLEEGY